MNPLSFIAGTLLIINSTGLFVKAKEALPSMLIIDAQCVKWQGRPWDPAVISGAQAWIGCKSDEILLSIRALSYRLS